MSFNQIQKTLYKKYYSSDLYSKVTSSHWRDFGAKTKVTHDESSFDFNAYGISTFGKKSTLGAIKHLSIDMLLSKMLSKHCAVKETIHAAKDITNDLNIHFDFDHAKHVLIYDLLNSYGLFNSENLICIIGDGHGFFGTLIKSLCPDAKILFINLGRNLLIDIICFSKIFPNIEPLHLRQSEDITAVMDYSTIFLEAEQYNLMKKLPISLFINIASMQEMDMSIIQKYFEYMRTSTIESYFYCCNREEKTLPDRSVIRFADYPWGGEVLLDELCPWYQKYPSLLPPFWRPFDGAHRHRLVRL